MKFCTFTMRGSCFLENLTVDDQKGNVAKECLSCVTPINNMKEGSVTVSANPNVPISNTQYQTDPIPEYKFDPACDPVMLHKRKLKKTLCTALNIGALFHSLYSHFRSNLAAFEPDVLSPLPNLYSYMRKRVQFQRTPEGLLDRAESDTSNIPIDG